VPGRDAALAGAKTSLEHRLEVIGERRIGVAAAPGEVAEAVATLIVRDDSVAAQQVSDLVVPQAECLHPPVDQNDRGGFVAAEDLDVEPRPIRGVDVVRAAGQRTV
jgi:hypothetical protein